MYDLHIHTTCSDGKYSRIELLKKMNNRNFTWAAFADHNYFENDFNSLNQIYAKLFYQSQDVKLISGVELDIHEYSRLHLLAYDIKKPEILKKILQEKANENKEICRKIVDKIQYYYGIVIPFEELEKMAFNKNVTKNIIVQWLIDNGYAKNVYEAGMLYTSQYSPCYEKRSALKLEDAMMLIKLCDGISVMAHPSSMKLEDTELFDFIKYLKVLGLNGIEVFNADKTTQEQLLYYLKIADKLGMLTTSGSDFHREEETKVFGVENNYSKNFIKLVKERKR